MTAPAEEARTRQGLYRLAGEAFRPPEASGLSLLGSGADYLGSLDMSRFAYAPEWFALATQLLDPPALEDVQSDYVRLFGVGPASTPAPPVESFYRIGRREGGVGDFVARIQSEYRQMGVGWSGSAEPPDHIATELEAMSSLCRREWEAWESGSADEAVGSLRLQRTFLDRHLGVWAPLFTARALSANPGAFYSRLLEFIHSFVVHEKNLSAIRVMAVGIL